MKSKYITHAFTVLHTEIPKWHNELRVCKDNGNKLVTNQYTVITIPNDKSQYRNFMSHSRPHYQTCHKLLLGNFTIYKSFPHNMYMFLENILFAIWRTLLPLYIWN